MDWKKITKKATLIDEIKRSINIIQKEKILHSVLDFTVRLRSTRHQTFKNNFHGF